MANPTMPLLSESTAEALGGTVNDGTGVKHWAANIDHNSTPSAFSQFKNLEHGVFTLLAAACQGMVISLANGLNVGVYGMRYSIGGTAYYCAGDDEYTLTASSTNYVYLDTDETVKHSTTAFPASCVKLAVVTTDGSDVTAVQDRRFENYQVGAIENWWDYPAGGAVNLDGSMLHNVKTVDFSSGSETLDVDGAIAAAYSYLAVDTYGAAASDDLETITPVLTYGEKLYILRAANAARTVVVKDGVDNIHLLDGDFELDDTDKRIVLMQNGSDFYEICRNRNTLALLTAALDADGNDLINIGQLNLQTSELTISSGAVTVTGSRHSIDTEADAASDDLDTISGGSDGDLLLITQETAATREVTVKHLTGNIYLSTAADLVLGGYQWLLLMYRSTGSLWYEVARSRWLMTDFADTGRSIPYPLTAYLSGALSVKVYEQQIYVPVDITIHNVTGRVKTAPSGGTCIIDIRVDGSSIFASQAEMVNIADSAYEDTSAIKDYTVSAGSYIDFECEGANSAADATLMVNAYVAPQTPP